MKFKILLSFSLLLSIISCGDKKTSVESIAPIVSNGKSDVVSVPIEKITNEFVAKFLNDLPVTKGPVEIKGLKIGMTFKEVVSFLGTKPSNCCSGRNLVYVTEYFPETGLTASFRKEKVSKTEEQLPQETSALARANNGNQQNQDEAVINMPDPTGSSTDLDLNTLPDNKSVVLSGHIEIMGSLTEYTGYFPNGKLALLQIIQFEAAKNENSETHVLVDSFAKKFGVNPNIVKYKIPAMQSECETIGDNELKLNLCISSYNYMAGFKDSEGNIVEVEGQNINTTTNGATAIDHKVSSINMQTKDWFQSQILLKNKIQSQEQQKQKEETNKRNSDL